MVIGQIGRANLAEDGNHPTGDLRRHRRAAVDHVTNAGEELRRRRLLQKISAGARAQGIEDPAVVLVDGQDERHDGGMPLPNQPNTLDPRHSRQADVHQGDVGRVRRRGEMVERAFHRSKHPDAPETRRAIQQQREALANLALVLDDDRRNHVAAVGGRRSNVTVAGCGHGAARASSIAAVIETVATNMSRHRPGGQRPTPNPQTTSGAGSL